MTSQVLSVRNRVSPYLVSDLGWLSPNVDIAHTTLTLWSWAPASTPTGMSDRAVPGVSEAASHLLRRMRDLEAALHLLPSQQRRSETQVTEEDLVGELSDFVLDEVPTGRSWTSEARVVASQPREQALYSEEELETLMSLLDHE